MASIKYLYKNRKKLPFGSLPFFKAWAKRILTLRENLRRNNRKERLIGLGATIADTAEIGIANISGKYKNLSINEHTFIGRAGLALHDKIDIGKNVCINDGVQLLTATHDLNDPQWSHVKKPIIIKDYAWIATSAMILPGVIIGYGAVVGAGAVVRESIPDYGVVIGNPGILISKKRTVNLNYNPCEFLAGNLAWLNG